MPERRTWWDVGTDGYGARGRRRVRKDLEGSRRILQPVKGETRADRKPDAFLETVLSFVGLL